MTVSSRVAGSGSHDAEIGDHPRGSLGLDAERARLLAAVAVAERGDEVELVDEGALRLRHDDEDLAAAAAISGAPPPPGSRTFGSS